MSYKKVIKQQKICVKRAKNNKKRVKKATKSIKFFKFWTKEQKKLLRKEGYEDNRQSRKNKK